MNTLNVPDLNLRAAIVKVLNKTSDDPINTDEIADLRDLDVRESGVRDLTGLEYAKNLSHLAAGGNSVSNLSPLKELIHLKSWIFGVTQYRISRLWKD